MIDDEDRDILAQTMRPSSPSTCDSSSDAPALLRRASLLSQWIGPRVAVSFKARLAAGAVTVVCGAVLTIAAMLTPDPRGYGTHQQLGTRAFAPCGTMVLTGYPCPTCGMTTSFAHLMHGHLIASFIAQPAGMLLCVATIVALFVSATIALRGRAPIIYWERIGSVRIALTLAFIFLGGWTFKVAHGLLAGTLPVR